VAGGDVATPSTYPELLERKTKHESSEVSSDKYERQKSTASPGAGLEETSHRRIVVGPSISDECHCIPEER